MAVKDSKSDYGKALKRLFKLVDQASTAHGSKHIAYKRWHLFINLAALLSSAVLLALAMIGDDLVTSTLPLTANQFKWVLAAAAVSNFSLTLIDLYWKPAEKSGAHNQALSQLSKIKYLIIEQQTSGVEVTREDYQRIQEQYSLTNEFPRLSDAEFLKYKRQHCEKVAISKELDRDPPPPILAIRLKLLALSIMGLFTEPQADAGRESSADQQSEP